MLQPKDVLEMAAVLAFPLQHILVQLSVANAAHRHNMEVSSLRAGPAEPGTNHMMGIITRLPAATTQQSFYPIRILLTLPARYFGATHILRWRVGNNGKSYYWRLFNNRSELLGEFDQLSLEHHDSPFRCASQTSISNTAYIRMLDAFCWSQLCVYCKPDGP